MYDVFMIFNSVSQLTLDKNLNLEYLFKQSCEIFRCQIYIYQFFQSSKFSGSQQVFMLSEIHYLATLLINTLFTYSNFHQRSVSV